MRYRRLLRSIYALSAVTLLAGCGARSELIVCERGDTKPCESLCGPGLQVCVGGQWLACNAPAPDTAVPIQSKIRDFHASHPDFEEDAIGLDLGMVAGELGGDGKPVYAGNPTTPTTSGKANFDQWFRDVNGVNLGTSFSIDLKSSEAAPSVYIFDSQEFFPIDGQLFGNEGNDHNYHFTLEMQVDFRYSGGELFTFRGDDDVFAFINGHLAIDLGGVHSAEVRTVDLDVMADTFGTTPGEVYPLALFFAERHTTGSSFYVETTIAEFDVCPE